MNKKFAAICWRTYGCSVPVYFKILKCRKDFDRFPYFYISGKEYILWIYANPRHPEDTTNVAIPGVEGFKEIPKEIFGDFTKAKDAVIYALYKEDVIPQDYSGFKRVFCRNKADYRVVRDFGRGVTLIPAERLSKKYIFARARESFGKENLFTVVPAFSESRNKRKPFGKLSGRFGKRTAERKLTAAIMISSAANFRRRRSEFRLPTVFRWIPTGR